MHTAAKAAAAAAAKPGPAPEPAKQPAPTPENATAAKPYAEAPEVPKPVVDPTAAALSPKPAPAVQTGIPPDLISLNDVIKLCVWAAHPTSDPAEAAARRGEVREILLRVLDQIAPE